MIFVNTTEEHSDYHQNNYNDDKSNDKNINNDDANCRSIQYY